jgi:histone deacetylase HOS3
MEAPTSSADAATSSQTIWPSPQDSISNIPATPSANPRDGQAVRRSVAFIQDVCYQHRFIRSRDVSTVVERPERLRAVKIGLAAAIARVENTLSDVSATADVLPTINASDSPGDELASALARMHLETTRSATDHNSPITIVHSSASVDILNNRAVKFIHGDIDGDVYLENLKNWIMDSEDKIKKGESEIPESLSQSDLYRELESFSPKSWQIFIPNSLFRLAGCYSRRYWHSV